MAERCEKQCRDVQKVEREVGRLLGDPERGLLPVANQRSGLERRRSLENLHAIE